MTDKPNPPSPEEIGLFAYQVWNCKQGEMVSLLIHLGDRLGLYRAMRDASRRGERRGPKLDPAQIWTDSSLGGRLRA